MANPISYIGCIIAVSISAPATYDNAGFSALSYTPIGKIVSWGPIGDTHENISIPLLAGRVEHVNGAADGGESQFTIRFDTDAGQTILINNSGTNNQLSFKITDPDTKVAYHAGIVANVQDMERSNGAYKGITGVTRINTATIRP